MPLMVLIGAQSPNEPSNYPCAPSRTDAGVVSRSTDDAVMAMQMLPLTAATSFEHRGPQCFLALTRSTTPPPKSVPCACVLVSPLYYKPSVMVLARTFS